MWKKWIGMMVLAECLVSATVWGKSFSLDLRPNPAKAGGNRAARDQLAAAVADGVVRSFNLDAGAADVGAVALGDVLAFTLFDDVTLSLTLKEKMLSPLGGDVFLAEVAGYEGIQTAVVLRTADGLTIDVQDFLNDKVYRVVSSPAGVKVSEIQPSHAGKCGCDALETPIQDEMPSADRLQSAPRPSPVAEQEDTCIDILVAYDQNAVAYANSSGAGLTNFALVAVQKMNAALANTGLDEKFRFRLVGVCALDVSATSVHDALYAIGDNEDGWADVKTVREVVGADIVTTLIDTGSAYGSTGVGWSLQSETGLSNFGNSAYNVCAIRAVEQGNTMAHECGHNLGAGHSDVQKTQPGPQLYEYSAGYFFTVGDNAYGTIMAYEGENPSGARTTEVPFFSSPNYTYAGVAVGDAMHDNAQTIANTFSYAVNWRAQTVPMSYAITFEPESGTLIDGSLQVTLTPGKAGTAMRYTLGGSDPMPDSPLYTGPITLTGKTTVKASTFVDGECSFPYEATYYSKTDYGYALGLPELVWTASGDWRVQTTNTVDGVALETPDVPDAVAQLTTTLTGPLTLTFKYRQEGYYKAEVLCDGDAVWSATQWYGAWQGAVAEIPAGNHQVAFRVTTTYGYSENFFGLDVVRLHSVRMPSLSPATTATTSTARTFEGELLVSLTSEEEGASIYYTLDGSDPNEEDALLYNGPFFVRKSTRVRAVASIPGKGESAVAEGVYVERHVPKAGEWTLWGEGAYEAVAESGRLIAELYWDYPGCGWSKALEPVMTSDAFTTWAAANGVYLLADSWGDQEGASGSRFWSLYRSSDLYSQQDGCVSPPTFVFASASDTGTCLDAMLARNDSLHTVNGLYYLGTPESLIACFASFFGVTPPDAPVASVTDAVGLSFPFSLTLSGGDGSASIYYTLDGSVPTRENGIRYTGEVTIPAPGTTLKAVVWPDGANAVSGIPLTITYQSLDEVIGIDGITWENDASLPWTISKTSDGIILFGGKDHALTSGTVTSTLTATFSKPGTFHFKPTLWTRGGSSLSLNGDTVLAESTNCSVTVNAGEKLVWTYTYWYGDSGSWYCGKLDSLLWVPSSVPDPVSGLTASQGEYEYGTVLRWTASSGATSYAVYRNTENDSDTATQIGTTEKCQYWDTEGEVGETYWYWVKAINENGEGEFSAAVSGWRPIVYSIAYNANGGRGSMAYQSCRSGGSLTVAANEFRFAGQIFVGWATQADGAVVCKPGDSVTVTSDMTFFAVWEIPSFDFGGDADWMYLGDGVWQSGSIGDNCETWIQKTVSGSGRISFDWSVSSETGCDELRFFIDGNRRSWISGSSAWTTKSFDISGTGNHVLKWVYAKDNGGRSGSDCGWIRNVGWESIVTVTFNANGGSGGRSVTLTSGTPLSAPTVTRTGYAFTGWSPAVPATVPERNTTYTAQWAANQYTIIFHANGGAGTMEDLLMVYDVARNLPKNAFEKEGFRFKGWATSATGKVAYKDGTSVKNLSASQGAVVTLFAVWADGTVPDYALQEEPGYGNLPSAYKGGTFNGYVLDAEEQITGTFVLAVKKPAKGKNLAAATLTFVSLATGKKTKVNGNVNLATGEGSGALAGLTLGADAAGGTVAKVGTLEGGADAAKTKNAAALAVLAKFSGKSYVLALGPEDSDAFAQGGYSTLAITMAAKGKAKISGVLADGTKVSAAGVMTVGEEFCCVPVIYSKKSKLGFVAWFDKNTRELLDVTALTPWKNTVKPAFTMAWEVFGLGAKSNVAAGRRTVELDGVKIAGFVPGPIAQTPFDIPLSVSGAKWDAGKAAKVAYKGGNVTVTGTNVSGLKLTYTAKTGLFKGSFTVYAVKGGKLTKNKFNVFGAVTGGVGYGTAVLKGKGSVAVLVE